jgi:hypothetical protein
LIRRLEEFWWHDSGAFVYDKLGRLLTFASHRALQILFCDRKCGFPEREQVISLNA